MTHETKNWRIPVKVAIKHGIQVSTFLTGLRFLLLLLLLLFFLSRKMIIFSQLSAETRKKERERERERGKQCCQNSYVNCAFISNWQLWGDEFRLYKWLFLKQDSTPWNQGGIGVEKSFASDCITWEWTACLWRCLYRPDWIWFMASIC